MLRVLLGVIKGGAVGLAVGFLASKVALGGGASGWLVYGLVGFLVGIVCGRPVWRQETLWTPILKGIVGLLLSIGLYWLARKALGDFRLPFAAEIGAPDQPLVAVPVLFAPILGILYGVFVEIDDGERKAPAASSAK